MKLEYLSPPHFGRNGLHCSKTGKLRFAKSIQSEVEKLMLKRYDTPQLTQQRAPSPDARCLFSASETRRLNSLRILTWKINGLRDKLGDPDVQKLIDAHDVIVLLGSWDHLVMIKDSISKSFTVTQNSVYAV